MKNKLVLVLLSALVLLSGCAQKNESQDVLDSIMKRGKIVFGVKYDTKPFGFIDEKQKLQGYDIDLAKYIAKSILGDESRAEFKQVTPSNRILALNSGQVDMIIATMTITPQRKDVIDFSIPYFVAGQAILVPQKSDINSVSDLNGKRVIIIFGSTAEKNLQMAAPEAVVLGFKTYTSGYSALKQGRADAMTSDDTILVGFAHSDNSMRLLPRRYTKEPYGIGFKKDPSTKNLQDRVNFILNEMRANGEMLKLKHKWIKF